MGTWQLDPYHTQIEFATKHLGFMTVRGHKIRFTTVNLSAHTEEMLNELRSKICEPHAETTA